MVDVISVGRELLSVIAKAVELAETKKQNNSILQELQKFYQDLNVNIRQLQAKALCNNSAKWALDALQKDLEYALIVAKKILKQGFIRSFWNANKIQSSIQDLRERVMTSFQTRLSIASLDVALESKHDQDAFRAAMLNVNKELQEMYISTSASIKQEQQLALRRQLGGVLQPIMAAMESQSNRIDGAVSMISNIQPQTSDAEKFRVDVLAALGGLSVRAAASTGDGGRSGASSSTTGALKWYQDPVTWETMCDPVKATDGHTYDRWTILGNGEPDNHGGLDKSPFRPDDKRPFGIAAADLDVRSRLYHKFPAYEAECQKLRAKYKETALQKVELQHYGDAAMMLKHVLEWAPRDVECNQGLNNVQRILISAADDSDSANSDAANSDAAEWESADEDLHDFGSSTMPGQDNGKELPDTTSMTRSETSSSASAEVKWFQDPVTFQTMCDPVKATDGHTYDRWTIVGRNGAHVADLDKSPFTADDPAHPFRIAGDDLHVRSRLFREFPYTEQRCEQYRAKYRRIALQEARHMHVDWAAVMLAHVLEWAPHDVECNASLKAVHPHLKVATESKDDVDRRQKVRKYGQPYAFQSSEASMLNVNNKTFREKKRGSETKRKQARPEVCLPIISSIDAECNASLKAVHPHLKVATESKDDVDRGQKERKQGKQYAFQSSATSMLNVNNKTFREKYLPAFFSKKQRQDDDIQSSKSWVPNARKMVLNKKGSLEEDYGVVLTSKIPRGNTNPFELNTS